MAVIFGVSSARKTSSPVTGLRPPAAIVAARVASSRAVMPIEHCRV